MRKGQDKKRIAFLIDNITLAGGTERVTAQLANELSKKYKVMIFSIKTTQEKKFQIVDEVKIISFHGEKIKNKLRQRLHTGNYLKRNCRAYHIDILIVVETYKFLNLIPVLPFIKKNGTKIITWEHFNYYADKKYSVKWWGRWFSARYSDVMVVLGKRDLKSYRKNFSHINRLEYIYNLIAVDGSRKADVSGKNVLAVGRLEEQKGFDYLLDIWKMIEDSGQYNDWSLQLIGSGSWKNRLEKQAEELNLRNLEILPFQKDIEKYYEEASVFVLTSRYEGFVLVLLEAQSYGLPVISFDIREGPGEIIDNGVNGYLIAPFDKKQFAQKLSELMGSEEKRKMFSRYAAKDLNRFDRNRVVCKWMNLIEGLCGNQ